MSKEIYNKFFEQYGPNVHSDPVRFGEIAKLCTGKVLDIGCGTGTLADFHKGSYVGIDISDVAIKMARKSRRSDACFEFCDVLIANNTLGTTFNTIVMAEFLEHIKDDSVVFDKIKKWAKPNTRLIISVPNGDRIPDPTHLRTFTIPELRKKLCPLGKVKFYNWPGAKARILLTVDLGQKNDNLLSLVMPVKNEGKGLEKAILSCINFVDNIVVSVDTQSTDLTLDIAKRYADIVKQHKWENSFAKARNFAQEGIKTKWVLALDGHEFVENTGNLAEMLKTDVTGLVIRIRLENGFTFTFPRIIRSEIKWEKDVHNYPLFKEVRKFTNFVIVHDRIGLQSKKAAAERDKQREKMVLDIMGKEIKKDKTQPRPYFYIAQLYHAEPNFKMAIKFYKKYLKFSKWKGERWLAFYNIAAAYNIMGKNLWALWYLFKANEEIPNRWEISKMLGVTYACLSWTNKAIEYFVDSFKENTGDFSFNPERRDDAQTWDFIGLCFFHLGQNSKAKVAWKRALEIEKKTTNRKIFEERIRILKRMTE